MDKTLITSADQLPERLRSTYKAAMAVCDTVHVNEAGELFANGAGFTWYPFTPLHVTSDALRLITNAQYLGLRTRINAERKVRNIDIQWRVDNLVLVLIGSHPVRYRASILDHPGERALRLAIVNAFASYYDDSQ